MVLDPYNDEDENIDDWIYDFLGTTIGARDKTGKVSPPAQRARAVYALC